MKKTSKQITPAKGSMALLGSLGNRLRDAIVRFQEANPGMRLQAIAKAAGVSSGTIAQILKGEYGPGLAAGSHHGAADNDKPSAKQLQGWAEAVTRLCLFLRVDANGNQLKPREVLKEINVPLVAVVEEAIGRVELRQVAPKGASDPVLDAISGRHGQCEVRVGILRWAPFVEFGEEIDQSWAWRFMRRLIGCVNPVWECEPVDLRNIDDALDGVFQGAKACDVVFGMYDTPHRRLRGLDFVHIPGLGIPLGAVIVPLGDGSRVTWPDILDPDSQAEKFTAAVLANEVGHLFLWGPCRYPKKMFEFIKADGTSAMAAEYARHVMVSKRHIVFVADAATCYHIHLELTKGEAWLSEHTHLTDSQRQEYERRMRSAVLLDPDDPNVPIYRLGISVRADAWRWKKLLEAAIQDEMFRNAILQTARSYAELLANTPPSVIKPLPLLRELQQPFDKDFADAVRLALLKSKSPFGTTFLEERAELCRAQFLGEDSPRKKGVNGNENTES